MSPRTRLFVLLPALAGMGALLAWSALALPRPEAPPPPTAQLSTTLALHGRHVTNTVSGITFDLRGFDTLGEELILFVAATGTAVLLRRRRRDAPDGEPAGAEVTAPLRSLGGLLVAPMLVLGAYLVGHGQLTPGGGFQGGVLLAAALLLVYAAGHVAALRRVRPMALVEVAHALGAAAYGLVAVGGLVFAGAAMANFLGFGTESQLLSGGTIPVLNVAVGLEVTGALTLIASEFLAQLLLQGAED